MSIQAIVTDIEGTTTKLTFVKEVLFPYAYKYLHSYVMQHADEPKIKILLNEAREFLGNDNAKLEDLIEQFQLWIEQDKKNTSLKTLQGYIWQEGYKKGELVGHVYDDVLEKLTDWREKGLILSIFSSGSVLAQKLLFSHTSAGDLTYLFSHYFDTTTGPKNEVESYVKISKKINILPKNILFLSDVGLELDAAKASGMQTCALVREDQLNSSISGHIIAKNFYEVEIT